MASAAVTTGNLDRALAYVERALPILEQLDMHEDLEDAMTTKAYWMMISGRHREAKILFVGALDLADEAGNQTARADALMMLGIVVLEDNPRMSLQRSLEGVEAARRAGVRGLEAGSMGNAAEAATDLGEWAIADELLSDLAGRIDLPPRSRQALALNRALLAAYRGRAADAAALLTEQASELETTDFLMARTWFLRARASAELMAGDLDAAYTTGMEAVETEPSGGNAPTSVWCAARAALWLRDAERARTARKAMDELRGRWIENCRRAVDAGVAALEGHLDDALAGYQRTFETWDAMDLPFDRAACVVDAATLLPAEALPRETIDKANAYLQQLGAAPLLERLVTATGLVPMEVGLER
jgi:tetratricopeptide (TPR) repeat protein